MEQMLASAQSKQTLLDLFFKTPLCTTFPMGNSTWRTLPVILNNI